MPAQPEQIDTRGKAHVADHATDFSPISLLEEAKRGGWAPRMTPVGHGKVKPNKDNPGTRGASDYYEANETEND